MKVSEIIGSLSLLALGIFMTWQATKLSLGTPRAPGPGFFPFYAALLLIGISLTIFLQALQKKQGEREGGRRWERVVLTLALIFVYALILESVGYLLATFLLIFFLLRMMIRKGWWFAPLLAGALSLGSYVLFKIWLNVLLPRGMLGF